MTPVTLFDVDAALLEALERRFGPPLDSYLMGWQVWLEPATDAEDAPTLEYRLHPPAEFVLPGGISHHDLWDAVITQIAEGSVSFQLGGESRELAQLWTLLEVFPAHGDPTTPLQVQRWAESALEIAAIGAGEVDHERLGGRWKRARHQADIPAALRAAISG